MQKAKGTNKWKRITNYWVVNSLNLQEEIWGEKGRNSGTSRAIRDIEWRNQAKIWGSVCSLGIIKCSATKNSELGNQIKRINNIRKARIKCPDKFTWKCNRGFENV